MFLYVFQLLTNHYEQNWKYYCLPSGWGSYGTASEDELLLTKKIFWGVFESLSQRVRKSPQTHSNISVRAAQYITYLLPTQYQLFLCQYCKELLELHS